jgi:hypothetical protein
MKKCLLGLCLLALPLIVLCQEEKPDFDLVTNNITPEEKIQTNYLIPFTKCIVNIESDGGNGQGIIVGPDLVITSYSLVAGRSGLSYRDASGSRKYFDGYIAADPSRGIILLKTQSAHPSWLNPGFTYLNPYLPWYNSKMYLLHRNGNRYTIDRAELSDNKEPSGDPKKLIHIPRQVVYNGKQPIPGHLVFDRNMQWAGIITYFDGKPFQVNNRSLLELYLFKDLAPLSLSDLPSSVEESDTKKKSKPLIYKVGLVDERKTNNGKKIYDILSLDYVKREKQKLDLYFTFKSVDWSKGTKFDPILKLVDLKTGIIYHASANEFPSNFVYNSTSYRTAISYENVPPSVNHVKLFNFPEDLYKYESELRNKATPSVRRFFDDVIINNFPTTSKTDYDLEQSSAEEGTVTFYALKSSNLSGNVRIMIEGEEAGTITRYYSDENTTEFCGGSASVTVRLKTGEYTYKAIMDKKKIERKFMIQKGKCNNQLIKF